MSSESRPDPPVPAPVARLVPRDTLRVDAEPLLRLRNAEGVQAAQAMIARAREDLDHRLDRVTILYGRGEIDPMAAELRGIAATALPLGLTDLVRAGSQAADCARLGNSAAVAATVARVVRLGERARALIGTLRAPGA